MCVYGLLPSGPPPDAPTHVRAASKGRFVEITWTPVPAATTYTVESTQGGTAHKVASGLTHPEFTEPVAETGTVQYVVIAVNTNGQSIRSAIASATVQGHNAAHNENELTEFALLAKCNRDSCARGLTGSGNVMIRTDNGRKESGMWLPAAIVIQNQIAAHSAQFCLDSSSRLVSLMTVSIELNAAMRVMLRLENCWRRRPDHSREIRSIALFTIVSRARARAMFMLLLFWLVTFIASSLTARQSQLAGTFSGRRQWPHH